MPRVVNGQLTFSDYFSSTTTFVADNGEVFIAQTDLKLDWLVLRAVEDCKNYPHLMGQLQDSTRDDKWRGWLGKLSLEDVVARRYRQYNFHLFALPKGLRTRGIPRMLQLQETCLGAGGR